LPCALNRKCQFKIRFRAEGGEGEASRKHRSFDVSSVWGPKVGTGKHNVKKQTVTQEGWVYSKNIILSHFKGGVIRWRGDDNRLGLECCVFEIIL